jgi:hypothetical protein
MRATSSTSAHVVQEHRGGRGAIRHDEDAPRKRRHDDFLLSTGRPDKHLTSGHTNHGRSLHAFPTNRRFAGRRFPDRSVGPVRRTGSWLPAQSPHGRGRHPALHVKAMAGCGPGHRLMSLEPEVAPTQPPRRGRGRHRDRSRRQPLEPGTPLGCARVLDAGIQQQSWWLVTRAMRRRTHSLHVFSGRGLCGGCRQG